MRRYKTFNYPNSLPDSETLLTGIRKIDEKKYLISGFYKPESDAKAKSFLYKGDLNGRGKWYDLSFHHRDTNLYGPNYINKNFVQVVGNYFSGSASIGCLYEGKLDGSGKWIIVIPPFSNTINTILHSTVGGLAVGNYEISDDKNKSKAFIYNIKNGDYYDIVKEGAVSISAYGIVQLDENKYTICGGFIKDLKNVAYLVDFDCRKKKFSNWREYSYNNDFTLVTHFDGIDYNGKYYTLTGDYTLGAFFFRKSKWNKVHYPNSEITSGNSVAGKVVIGVYKNPGEKKINGYVSF